MSSAKDNNKYNKTSFLAGNNSSFIEEFYSEYLLNPERLPEGWRSFFDGLQENKNIVSENNIATFETGVRYQMYHVLALLFLGFVTIIPEKAKKWIFYFFLSGMFLFSGSIYLLALNEVISFFDFRKIGFLTPIGGLLFICGWLRLAFAAFSLKSL